MSAGSLSSHERIPGGAYALLIQDKVRATLSDVNDLGPARDLALRLLRHAGPDADAAEDAAQQVLLRLDGRAPTPALVRTLCWWEARSMRVAERRARAKAERLTPESPHSIAPRTVDLGMARQAAAASTSKGRPREERPPVHPPRGRHREIV
jgi:hypothetical protein